MADNLKQRGGQDRKRIDVTQDYELRHCSKRFGVIAQTLKEAVKKVGDRAEAVEKHLQSSTSERKPAKRSGER
jgi:hypothetical protein